MTTMTSVQRAARMTGLKKPRPLKRVVDDKVNNTTEVIENENESDKNNNVCIKTGERKHGQESKKSSTYTAIITVKGDKPERLVLASTSMKVILKAASLLACNMDGELVHIDSSDGAGDQSDVESASPENINKSKIPHHTTQNKTSSVHNENTNTFLPLSLTANKRPPSRAALLSHRPDLPDLVSADYGRRTFYEEERHNTIKTERREHQDHQIRVKSRSPSSLVYTEKDLLLMSRQPHSKLPPRNWPLIKQAFPELVGHEDHYFEPFDLKACSSEALGRPSKPFDIEKRCHMDSLEFM